ncbi:nucleoside phosphorylase [Candidatus Xianfuyuplasma coldseepsis]|uniref:Uridine phosphorylase n=1 Tax=Candidatus Xianfuyuplasma coldseepsis TaxID=2782163 RepID=A0A7L7KRE2_9MOLU|nr:nucleoside phosphorylase [Xianfuyuplasma coldseepsis]QMS85267.1 nucleoside phosphorylase [Xianfuyuplasma coldseepsis]
MKKAPILETRGLNETGVISPNIILDDCEKLPEHIDTAVMLFDGHPDEDLLKDAKPLFRFVGASYRLQQYLYKDSIVLSYAPLGSAAAGGLLEELIAIGIKKVIACGSSGLIGEFDPKKVILVSKAIRDEGLSYHYMEPSVYVETNKELNVLVEKELKAMNIDFKEDIVWTTDAFYRETKSRIEIRKQQGAVAVEMECAGMAAVAKFRDIQFSQILYFSDIVKQDTWSGFLVERRKIKDIVNKIAVDIAMKIAI